jgi:chlorite dismutase
MNYEVIEGKQAAFEKHFAIVVGVMEEMAGHVKTQLFHGVAEPRTYLIVSAWNDRAAFDAFVSSDRFRKVAAWGMSGILARRPTHEVYGEGVTPSSGKCPAQANGHPHANVASPSGREM